MVLSHEILREPLALRPKVTAPRKESLLTVVFFFFFPWNCYGESVLWWFLLEVIKTRFLWIRLTFGYWVTAPSFAVGASSYSITNNVFCFLFISLNQLNANDKLFAPTRRVLWQWVWSTTLPAFHRHHRRKTTHAVIGLVDRCVTQRQSTAWLHSIDVGMFSTNFASPFFIFSPNANSSPPTHSHTHTWSDPAVAHKFRIWITVNCDVSFFEPKSTTTTTTTTIKRGSTDADVQHDNLRRPLPTTGSENSTDVNPTTRHSVYSVIIGGFFYWTSLFCTNQASVQKCMSLKSLNKAKKAIYFAILGKFQLLLCSRW